MNSGLDPTVALFIRIDATARTFVGLYPESPERARLLGIAQELVNELPLGPAKDETLYQARL